MRQRPPSVAHSAIPTSALYVQTLVSFSLIVPSTIRIIYNIDWPDCAGTGGGRTRFRSSLTEAHETMKGKDEYADHHTIAETELPWLQMLWLPLLRKLLA